MLKEGQLFFTPSNIPIAYYPQNKSNWKYAWFMLSTDISSQYIPLLGMDIEKPYCDMQNFNEIKDLLNNMFSSCEKNVVNSFCCLSAFMQILALEASPMESDIKPQNIHIHNIKKWIDSNFMSQDFSVDMLCGMMHMSHSYICRIFKAYEGITIVSYIENVRLSQAKKLLLQTNDSISKISETVGFRDPMYFMKCFKKKYGMTALQYRQYHSN